jgi:hypothetical protein
MRAEPLSREARLRAANLRTALVLAALALTFFVGVIASHLFGGYGAGMTAVGFAVFVFLAFAIGRALASRR